MIKFNIIAGLPRAGSTLLCQILNSNPKHHVTPTSAVLDMLKNMRSTFSHNPTFKGQNRLELMENFRKGLQGFLGGYFFDKEVVFDKSRGWSNNINLLDSILENNNTKMIFCYRDPVEIVSSIEAHYQKTLLLENADEAHAAGAFATLDRRIGTFINNDGIISYPVEILRDAIEMGHGNRILFVKYFDLCNEPQTTLDKIHEFIGEEKYIYDTNNVKQTTFEYDGFYNYKFPHTIKEGKVEYKKADINLPMKYIQAINERFAGLNKLIFTGDPSDLLGITMPPQELPQGEVNNSENTIDDKKDSPFKIE